MKRAASKVLLVFGTRPEALKLCRLAAILDADPSFDVRICVTGQHRELLALALRLYGRAPDYDLRLMRRGQRADELLARALLGIGKVLRGFRPAHLVVQGDTTTSLAAALAASYAKIPVLHVEGGLRTGDLRSPFPEEANRKTITALASLHFAPTKSARANLLREGVPNDAIVVTGNTAVDAVEWMKARLAPPASARRRTILVTCHRRESWGAGIRDVCRAIARIAKARPVDVVFPLHPNPRVRGPVTRALGKLPNVRLREPLAHAEFLRTLADCTLVLTDSGGVQEEAPSFGKPVLILRDETERPELLASGGGRLVGTDPDRIYRETIRLLDDPASYRRMVLDENPFGDGHASERIAARLARTRGKVCVVGLGYVGLPTALLFAERARVVGVDTRRGLAADLNRGIPAIAEAGTTERLACALARKRFRARRSPVAADLFLIAVPTPLTSDKRPDLRHVEAAAESIAPYLRPGNLVVLESTSPIGTTERLREWILARRPDLRADDVDFAYCPERVLPGNIFAELVQNDRLVGGLGERATERAAAWYRTIVSGRVLETDARTAELTKLAENSWRDVSVAFANEMSRVCDRVGCDVWELIRLANHHPRVKLLRPGPGVGGHCVSVDPWFLVAAAPDLTPLARTAREVNDAQPRHVARKIRRALGRVGGRRVALLGLTYKADTDDVRESPAVAVARALAKRGIAITVVDPHVARLPRALDLPGVRLVDLASAVRDADLVVLLVDHAEFKSLGARDIDDKPSIDTRGVWSHAGIRKCGASFLMVDSSRRIGDHGCGGKSR